jgi:type II secretory pathway component PulF
MRFSLADWKQWRLRHSPTAREDLYENLADLLDAGIPEADALQLLWDALAEKGREKGRPAACAVAAWQEALERADTFEQALRGWVPAAEQLLFTGPNEGKRVEALRQAADMAKRAGELRKAVLGNLFYPGVLAGLAIWMVWLMGTQIIPVLAQNRPGGDWRGAAAKLISASELLDHWGGPLLLGLVGITVVVAVSLPRWTGWPRAWLDVNMVPWSTYRLIQETSLLLALGAQMQSGVGMNDAIRELAEGSASWLRHRLLAILDHLEGGENLGAAMELADHGFPSGDVIGQIDIFDRSGTLTDRLPILAAKRVARAISRIKTQMSLVNILLMGLISLAIAGTGLGLVDLMDQTTTGVH